MPPSARSMIEGRSTFCPTPPDSCNRTSTTTRHSYLKWPMRCSAWKPMTNIYAVTLSHSSWTRDLSLNCPTCTRKRWPASKPSHWSTTLSFRTKQDLACRCFSRPPVRPRCMPYHRPTRRCYGYKARTRPSTALQLPNHPRRARRPAARSPTSP